MALVVRASQLHKSYLADKPVIRRADFELAEGELVSLQGANGSGKTTLLRILASLVLPDGGELEIAGESAIRRPEHARRVLSWVPASEGGFHPMLDGRSNLRFWAAYYDAPRGRLDDLVHEFSTLGAFRDALATPFYRCSTGMRQLLSVCRALLPEPRLLLLDEPFRSLDPETAATTQALVREQASRAAVLFSTHNELECERLSTRRLRIADGVVG